MQINEKTHTNTPKIAAFHSKCVSSYYMGYTNVEVTIEILPIVIINPIEKDNSLLGNHLSTILNPHMLKFSSPIPNKNLPPIRNQGRRRISGALESCRDFASAYRVRKRRQGRSQSCHHAEAFDARVPRT